MVQHFLKNFQEIPLREIDAEDRLFSISPDWVPIDRLIESVQTDGVLSPLHVQRRSADSYRLVTGWRRFRAAGTAGRTTVPCILREGNDLQLFLSAVRENAATRPLHLLEKARVLLSLYDQFSISAETLLDKFLPFLEIPPQRFQLDRHLSLARLPEALQKAIFESLDPEVALRLALWTPAEQAFFLDRVFAWSLGKNRQKQLFVLLDELRVGPDGNDEDGNALAPVWERSGCAVLEGDESLPPAHRFEQVLERLTRLRYPHLSEHRRRYQSLKGALRLPPQIQFHAPPYFEGSRIDVAFSFGSAEELSRLVGALQQTAERKELKDILDLL